MGDTETDEGALPVRRGCDRGDADGGGGGRRGGAQRQAIMHALPAHLRLGVAAAMNRQLFAGVRPAPSESRV